MSAALYSVLVGAVAVQRLVELRIASRNERALRARGAREAGRAHYAPMVVLHALFLLSCVAEVWLARRPFIPWLGVFALALLCAAQGLRYWAIRTLGERWTTRVLYVPGAPPVARGPYRFLRHPNYVAVAVEFAALPLVHTAYATALAFSALDALLLALRIRAEDALIAELRGRA